MVLSTFLKIHHRGFLAENFHVIYFYTLIFIHFSYLISLV